MQILNRDYTIKKEIENLEQKAKYLEELKDRIKTFRDNIDKMEFMSQNNSTTNEPKKSEDNLDENLMGELNESYESDFNEEELYIQKILEKGKKNFTEKDIYDLNKYFEKVKKNQ